MIKLDIKLFDGKAQLSGVYTIVRTSTISKGEDAGAIYLYTDKGEVFHLLPEFVKGLRDHIVSSTYTVG